MALCSATISQQSRRAISLAITSCALSARRAKISLRRAALSASSASTLAYSPPRVAVPHVLCNHRRSWLRCTRAGNIHRILEFLLHGGRRLLRVVGVGVGILLVLPAVIANDHGFHLHATARVANVPLHLQRGHADLLHVFGAHLLVRVRLVIVVVGEGVRVDAVGLEAGVVGGGEVGERGELLLDLALPVLAALGVALELAGLHLRGGLLPLQALDHEHGLAGRRLRGGPLGVELLPQAPRRVLRRLLLPAQPRRRRLQLLYPPDQPLRRRLSCPRTRLGRQLRRPRRRPPLQGPPRRRRVRDRIHGGMK
uniref:Uncharacterized protein n=1 Tax=Zea mays TaxID=4577 RepID=C0PLB7_MAIZE|nr:unknown [Zea mays]